MQWDAVIERCGQGNIDLVQRVLSQDPSACIPYSKPRRMTGVWLTGFEFSGFYEGAQEYADVATQGETIEDDTWLSPTVEADIALRSIRPLQTEGALHAYSIEILGRRTLCEGEYGHIGGSRYQVLPIEFLTIRSIPASFAASE
jgi:hypothetical protein